jgi:hypothetical protein
VANNSLAKFAQHFQESTSIIIEKTGPTIDLEYGIRTNHANGLYYTGETIEIFLKFTRPVVTLGKGIRVRVGVRVRVTMLMGYKILSFTKTSYFKPVF